MNLYQISQLENEIENIAKENNGVIPDELMMQLIEAQTKSLDKIENLCQFIKELEYFQLKAKEEQARIKAQETKAKNMVASMKKYLTPYIKEKGKLQAGTFTLSNRKSCSVEVLDEKAIDNVYFEEKTVRTLNKSKIKEELKNKKIKGVVLLEKDNLQIK